MQLKVGDKVRFIDTIGHGIVVGFKHPFFVTVRDSHGFEMNYHMDKLIGVNEELNQELEQTKVTEERIIKDLIIKKKAKVQSSEKEIDLHIENLIEDYSRMSNYEMLSLQLNVCRKELEQAIKNKKTRRLIFIHGIGEGVLKHEIMKVLQEYENLQFRAGSFTKYGNGATEVNFY